MYSGKASGSLFTDVKGGGEGADDLSHVQSAEKCVFHHPEEHGGLCLQEKGFCFSKQALYLSSLHHFLRFDKQKQTVGERRVKAGFFFSLSR